MKRFAALLSIVVLSSCNGFWWNEERPFSEYDGEEPIVIEHQKSGEFYTVGSARKELIRGEDGRVVASAEELETIMPDVYAILATRATNKMLDETSHIHSQRPAPKLFIRDIQAGDELPSGFFAAERQVRRIIDGSRTFTLVNNVDDADYTLTIELDKVSSSVPSVKYTVTLYDDDNEQVNQWIETIRQVGNDDRSWW